MESVISNGIPKPNGLVLIGGKSSRMGRDKSDLTYWDLPQWQHVSRLIAPFCSEVFLSCRNKQHPPHSSDYEVITDYVSDWGPMGAILSAFERNADRAWLVVACDLPFLTDDLFEQLTSHRNPRMHATAFVSKRSGLPEPLCTLYEPLAFPYLQAQAISGNLSPQRALANMSIAEVTLLDDEPLHNVNFPEEYLEALAKIGKHLK